MKFKSFAAFLLTASVIWPVGAQQTSIENCLTTAPDGVRVEYQGKTYSVRDQACKDLFETDPERFSQLFDALLESDATPVKTSKPKAVSSASLVPS